MAGDVRTGFIAALAAYLIWGSLPLYLRALDGVPPDQILAHRILWSLPTGLVFIAVARHWNALAAVLTWRRVGWLAISALLIGTNWLLYIWAVSAERVMEASLGYYINPLVNVLLGMVLFSERLRPAQWAAVALAGCGVAVLAVAFGRLPWIALVLCFTFAFYGVVRKQVAIDGRAGFVVEAALLAPLAGLYLGWLIASGAATPFAGGGLHTPLLIASGLITAVPLICFTVAAQRLSLSTIGMMQYGAPTLQFAIAVFIFGETFTWTHGAAFALIWTGLIIFTADSVMGNAKARRLARAAKVA